SGDHAGDLDRVDGGRLVEERPAHRPEGRLQTLLGLVRRVQRVDPRLRVGRPVVDEAGDQLTPRALGCGRLGACCGLRCGATVLGRWWRFDEGRQVCYDVAVRGRVGTAGCCLAALVIAIAVRGLA